MSYRVNKEKKLSNEAENNTAIASTSSKYIKYKLCFYLNPVSI